VPELVRHGDRGSVQALTRLARRDPSPEVRAAAAEGLRELGAEDAIAERSQDPAGPEGPSETEETPPSRPRPGGIDYDSMSTESLVTLLSDPDLDVRTAAVDALAHNQRYGAIPELWNAFFREPDWSTQELILDALEEMGQEVEEARELLYMSKEKEIDWDRLAESVQ
jgi:HEAT repeat protein